MRVVPSSSGVFRVVAAALVLGLAALGLGCEVDTTPQLLRVAELTPGEAEVGDTLVITGEGFPQGRAAHVRFHGTLARPGEGPEQGELEVEGVASSPREVQIRVDDSLQSLFCGSGEAAVHTTFHGTVEVAFRAAAPGAPPVAGTLGGVTLDLRPPPPREGVATIRDEAGQRLLGHLGLHVDEARPASGGLLLTSVEPGSRGDGAGLLAGQLLVSAAGVRVRSLGDLVPPPGATLLELGERREGSTEERVHTVNVEGFVARAQDDLVGASVLLTATLTAVLLFVAPLGGPLPWLVDRILRARRRALAGGGALAPRTVTTSLAVGMAALAFGLLPVMERAFGGTLDLGVLGVLGLCLDLSLALVSRPPAGSSRLRVASAVVRSALPVACAVAGVVLMAGSLRVRDIVAAQGASPWTWFAFRSPLTLVLLCVLATATLLGPSPRSTARVAVLSSLAATLFLGGGALPGGRGHAVWDALAAAVLVLKAGAVAMVLLRARAVVFALGGNTPGALGDAHGARGRLLTRVVAPVGLVAVALTWVSRTLRPSLGPEPLVSGALLAAFAVMGLAVALRARHRPRRMSVNPFL